MTSEKYEKRKQKIQVWYNDYINENFFKINHFGHLEEFHLNKTEDFLKRRSVHLKKNCSSFYGDEKEVINLLKSTLIKNREEIIEYLADEEDDDVWEILESFPENCKVSNKVYLFSHEHDWENGALNCDQFKISIKKHPDENGFYVTSAYPFY